MRKMVKCIRRKLYRNSSLLRRWWFWINFVKKNKYIPDFKNPKTYNEKINLRKKEPRNPLFSVCADKVRAKEYVAENISPEIVIPNYYVGESITADQLKAIIVEHGDCLLKASHNSGPVYMLTRKSSDTEIRRAVEGTMQQLEVDFGKQVNESWYSNIKPQILVEKRLMPEDGESDIRDYKFHVFKKKNGGVNTFVAIDFDRATNHTRSFFDRDFKYMHLSTYVPSVITQVDRPKNYEKMLSLAEKLAEPFSYVRVDFYNVNGDIYFGEMTFAPGSGVLGSFESYNYDLWMGRLWEKDPSR